MAASALILLASSARAEELIVPGSGASEYVLSLLADAFNQQQRAHRVVVPTTTGTAGAIRDVDAGTAALGRIGRALTEAERARGLVYVPMARDSVTFVGGADVTTRTLSTQQILGIYTGQITQWPEVGGAHGPIRAIGREVSDTSRQAIIRRMAPFETIMFADRVKVVHLDSQMLDLLDRYPTSLGFLNRSALNGARTRLVEIALDGAMADPVAVAEGTYGLWVDLGLVHKAGRITPAARAFMDYVASPDGAALLTAQGLIVATRSRKGVP